jgi:hypothetical protein
MLTEVRKFNNQKNENLFVSGFFSYLKNFHEEDKKGKDNSKRHVSFKIEISLFTMKRQMLEIRAKEG